MGYMFFHFLWGRKALHAQGHAETNLAQPSMMRWGKTSRAQCNLKKKKNYISPAR